MKPTLVALALSGLLTVSLPASPGEFSSPTIGIGVVVRDLDQALAFYTGVVGMIQTGGFTINGDFAKRAGLTDGPSAQVKVLRLGDGEHATQWKLMTFGDAAKPVRSDHIHNHTGMRYITIHVTNLTPILRRIKQQQVRLLGETPVPLGPDNHFVLIQDPDGTFIELIGPMK